MAAVSETARRAVVAGRFYPGGAKDLRDQATAFLAAQPQAPARFAREDVLAVMLPHAGYPFSGAVAGATLGQIDVPDRLILLGPNHTGRGAPLSVWGGGGWESPLGLMPLDMAARELFLAHGTGFVPDRAAHEGEHSLEVLVPFFQVRNPEARILPIAVGNVPLPVLETAGAVLAEVASAAVSAGERILLVVSSDMSHFLPHAAAVEADAVALDALETLDPEVFFTVVRGKGISMCGVFPMTLALFALARLGAAKAFRIAYATSGQTGRAFGADMNRVVGYAGVVFTR